MKREKTRIVMLVRLLWLIVLPVTVYSQDSLKSVELSSIMVTANSYQKTRKLNSALTVETVEKDFLTGRFTGNLVQALGYIPGVRSMDIGAGFSKPMIRGMGFNRITVTENGIKQEGQQWGSDHGLEIDAFNIDRVTIRKGPSSLQYGSDAMGGVIEITPLPPPPDNQVFGQVSLLGKSLNGTLGASLMLGIRKDAWFTKIRYSEQHFGDYGVPTDSIVYLTQRIPIHNRRLKNTAGFERNVNLYTEYRKGKYYSRYAISNVYQKTGFFPGAHGIPDISRVEDDGDSRNIELPYSKVNHLKLSAHQQYMWNNIVGSWDIGYQNNHREEWSRFHTHYGNQSPPATDPDKELGFSLDTYSSSMKLCSITSTTWGYAELHTITDQHRVSRNENTTPGANLVNLGGSLLFPLGNTHVEVNLSVRNLLDTKYYNHLSFYRKVEIPEPGRGFQLLINIPFKSEIK